MKVIAIVIGNNNYYEPYKLNNAVNDATSMADVFNRLGYTVVSEYDCDNKKYEDLLRRLESDLPQYDASVFFYAGHGFQEDGENFLPSVECQVGEADKYTLRRNSLLLSELLDIYRKNDKKTHIAILDACRNHSQNRGGNYSFAPVDAPPGTLIAFSTSPNCAAKDSVGGEHSVYTEALLSYIGREQLTVETLFKKVRRTVAQWTNNVQSSIENGVFYNCESLTNVDFHSNSCVTSVGNNAFYGCKSLTSIELPSSVTSIAAYVFKNCERLRKITMKSKTPPTIQSETFPDRALQTLYVPKDCKLVYEEADYWWQFKEIIEEDTPQVTINGDMNGDGILTITDVMLLINIIVGQY